MIFIVNIFRKEDTIEESLKKLKLICELSNTTLKIINSSIRKINRANSSHHKITFKIITFLAFIITIRYFSKIYLT